MPNDVISIDAACVVTERSRSTWWRRVAKGEVARAPEDAHGRAMLFWSDVAGEVRVTMNNADIRQLLRADAGEVDAKSDVGQFFMVAGNHKAAIYWLLQAARQDNADAMHWLGGCYIRGEGVSKDENLGIMWIARAASLNHPIAKAQMETLLSSCVRASAPAPSQAIG